jgi:hypothetical protein
VKILTCHPGILWLKKLNNGRTDHSVGRKKKSNGPDEKCDSWRFMIKRVISEVRKDATLFEGFQVAPLPHKSSQISFMDCFSKLWVDALFKNPASDGKWKSVFESCLTKCKIVKNNAKGRENTFRIFFNIQEKEVCKI